MKKTIRKIGYGLLALPGISLAVTGDTFDNLDPVGIDETTSVETIIVNVINFILKFGIALAVLFIIIGGVMYIVSGGNDDRTAAAKKYILYSVIGLVVMLLALVIVTFVGTTVRNEIN